MPELRKVERFLTGEVFSTNPVLFYRGKVDTIVVIDGKLTLANSFGLHQIFLSKWQNMYELESL